MRIVLMNYVCVCGLLYTGSCNLVQLKSLLLLLVAVVVLAAVVVAGVSAFFGMNIFCVICHTCVGHVQQPLQDAVPCLFLKNNNTPTLFMH